MLRHPFPETEDVLSTYKVKFARQLRSSLSEDADFLVTTSLRRLSRLASRAQSLSLTSKRRRTESTV